MKASLPSLNALKAFTEVARLGSVNAAAEQLFVTHGAVSRQINGLQEQLGVTLFVKQGRGLKLTDEGEQLAAVCQQAFHQIHSACQQIREQQANQPFVLSCTGSLLARWLIPRLAQLNRALPDLKLQLAAAEYDGLTADVQAHLGFSSAPYAADMEVYELAGEAIGPVFSPHHAKAAQWLKQPAQSILSEALLHTSSRPQAWPQWATAQQLEVSQLNYGQGFEHLYYLLEAAVAGLGVAIAPQVLVAEDLAAGRLLAPWGFVTTQAKLVLTCAKARNDTRVQALAQWFQQQASAF